MKNRMVFILVVIGALFGWVFFLDPFAPLEVDSTATRTQLISELESFADYDEHRELLLGVIDREHQVAFEYIEMISRNDFSWENYRFSMYVSMKSALQDAGQRDIAMKLDRFQTGG